MKTTLAIIFAALAAFAQGATRPVSISWSASTSTGVTGYIVLRATSPAGPFAPIATTVGTSFIDANATIGQTYTYEVAAVGGTCAQGQTTSCGQGAPSLPITTTIPPQPAVVVTVTVSVL